MQVLSGQVGRIAVIRIAVNHIKGLFGIVHIAISDFLFVIIRIFLREIAVIGIEAQVVAEIPCCRNVIEEVSDQKIGFGRFVIVLFTGFP